MTIKLPPENYQFRPIGSSSEPYVPPPNILLVNKRVPVTVLYQAPGDQLAPSTIQLLNTHKKEFENGMSRQIALSKQDQEIAIIQNHPQMQEYYTYISRLLTSSWIACHAASSKMFERSKDNLASQVLTTVGTLFPIAQPAVGFLNLLIGGWDEREKLIFVQKFANRFPTLQAALNGLETIARKLTLERRETLQQFSGRPNPLDRGLGLVTGDDKYRSLITLLANQDCQKFLRDIKN